MSRKYYTKIRVEILGADIVIDNADIALDFTKTDEEKPNYCDVTIYNVSDDTYQRINNRANSARVYVDVDGYGYALVFAGNLRNMIKWKKAVASTTKKRKTTSKVKKAKVHYNEPPIRREGEKDSDVATIISLEDGRKSGFLDNHISISYSDAISNKKVLDDVLRIAKKKNSNLKVSANIDSLDEYIYPSGLVLHGELQTVLKSICKTGNAYCTIQDDVIIISSIQQDTQNMAYTYCLNSDNCPTPEYSTDKEIDIEAPFIPTLNPYNFVKLDFRDYVGLFQVKKVVSKIDNFGDAYDTKVTVKADV